MLGTFQHWMLSIIYQVCTHDHLHREFQALRETKRQWICNPTQNDRPGRQLFLIPSLFLWMTGHCVLVPKKWWRCFGDDQMDSCKFNHWSHCIDWRQPNLHQNQVVLVLYEDCLYLHLSHCVFSVQVLDRNAGKNIDIIFSTSWILEMRYIFPNPRPTLQKEYCYLVIENECESSPFMIHVIVLCIFFNRHGCNILMGSATSTPWSWWPSIIYFSIKRYHS